MCISLLGTPKFLSNFCETVVPSKAYVALGKRHKFLKKEPKIPLELQIFSALVV